MVVILRMLLLLTSRGKARNYASASITHNSPHPTSHLKLDLSVHLARIMAFEAWTDIESVRVVRDAHSQLAKGFAYVLFRDVYLQAIALSVANGSLYHNCPLRVYPCSNSRTVQVKKPRHNASARSQSESESAGAAAAASKNPRYEKNVSDTKPTSTLSMGKERLQSAAAAHRNSIAKGALKRLLAKELKQDAAARQQKKRRARGNTPSQKTKAKIATSAPKRRKKPDPQLQKKLQSAVHAMKRTSSKGGRSSSFSRSSRK